jgi:hypothetical protein
MSYKKQFDLNIQDIDVIEDCLRREIGSISRDLTDVQSKQTIDSNDRLNIIHSLLGKIHNQKNWFMGSGEVARIPRG